MFYGKYPRHALQRSGRKIRRFIVRSINDLLERYNTKSAGSMRKFISRNLDKINADGEHAKQTPDGWQFDAEAVRIIDELRGFNAVAVIEEQESERVKELQTEMDNLKTLLLAAQNELISSQKALRESEKKYLLAENQTELEKHKRESDKKLSDERIAELKSEIERLKNRGLLDRIFNNF